MVVELGGGEDGEDDEVEEQVEVRGCEACEEEGGDGRCCFGEEEVRHHWDCELQPHCHGHDSGGDYNRFHKEKTHFIFFFFAFVI